MLYDHWPLLLAVYLLIGQLTAFWLGRYSLREYCRGLSFGEETVTILGWWFILIFALLQTIKERIKIKGQSNDKEDNNQ